MITVVLESVRKGFDGRKARIAQVIGRAVSSMMLAIAGWIAGADAETIEQMPGFVGTIDAVGFLAVSLIGFALDLLIHRARHGGFLRDGAAAKNTTQ